jgi:hypothetical protein
MGRLADLLQAGLCLVDVPHFIRDNHLHAFRFGRQLIARRTREARDSGNCGPARRFYSRQPAFKLWKVDAVEIEKALKSSGRHLPARATAGWRTASKSLHSFGELGNACALSVGELVVDAL